MIISSLYKTIVLSISLNLGDSALYITYIRFFEKEEVIVFAN